VTACLLRALSSIEELWHSQNADKTPTDLSNVASERIRKIKEERKATGVKLGEAFTKWANKLIDEVSNPFYTPIEYVHLSSCTITNISVSQ
jgi:hypothetical protein